MSLRLLDPYAWPRWLPTAVSALGLLLLILAIGRWLPLPPDLVAGVGLALVFAVLGLEGARAWPRPWPWSGRLVLFGLLLLLVGLELAFFVRDVPWFLSLGLPLLGLALQGAGLSRMRARTTGN